MPRLESKRLWTRKIEARDAPFSSNGNGVMVSSLIAGKVVVRRGCQAWLPGVAYPQSLQSSESSRMFIVLVAPALPSDLSTAAYT